MIDRRTFCVAALSSIACRKRRGSGFPGYAFVANAEGQSVAAVDLTAFSVARHIRLDGNPTAIIAHPFHPALYVLTPANGAIHEIHADQLTFSRKVQVCSSALSMRLAPDGDAIYIVSRVPRQVIRLNLATLRVDWRWPLPMDPFDFDLAQNAKAVVIAVSFGSAGSIAFLTIDGQSVQLSKPIGVSREIGALTFQRNWLHAPDWRQLMVANMSDRMLSIFDVAKQALMVHLPLAVRPDHLCFNSDGGQLFVTGDGMDAVVIVFPYHTPQVAETLLAGHAPGAMASSTSPDYLFLASPQSGDVSILDINSRRLIAVTQVGTEPGFIAITPNNQYALVLNRLSGDMAVIRIPAIRRNPRRSGAALFTIIPVGSKPVSAVVRAV